MKHTDLIATQKWLRPIALGAAIGTGVCFCVLALGALILSLQDVPLGVVPIVATAAMVFGGFASGYACTRMTRERGLLLGSLCSTVFFIVLYIASLPGNGLVFSGDGVTSWVTVVFAGALGGVLGVNQKHKFR